MGVVQRTCVLIVEDEFLIRMATADHLSDAGFDVIEAGNADEAMAILNARGDIRVVVTDIDMPGSMDGLALLTVIRDRWPPVSLIVCSGVGPFVRNRIPVGVPILAKPVDLTTIEHQIRNVLKAHH